MTVTKVKAMSAFGVIMTIYKNDRLDFFESAVRSIEDQDCLESVRIYLCVDGEMKDIQEQYIHKNRNRFYKIIRNTNNIGLAASLNKLIEILEDEELIFRMDGDDISHSGRFSAQSAYMQSHPKISLVGCQAYDIDMQGRVLGEREFATEPTRVKELLCRMTAVLHPAFCIRRSLFENPAIRYPKAHLCEDTAFLVALSLMGYQLANLDQVHISWRLGEAFFERRRDPKRGWDEMKWHARAVRSQKGIISAEYIFPFLRFVLRCLPNSISKTLYRSRFRQEIMRSR